MSSVVPEPSIFPSVNPTASRGSAAHDSNGADAGKFAKMLDSEPAKEPELPARAKRNAARSERHNDTAQAKAARRGNGSPQAKQSDSRAQATTDVPGAQAQKTAQATTAGAQKDAAPATSAGDNSPQMLADVADKDAPLADATADALFALTPVAATPVVPAPAATPTDIAPPAPGLTEALPEAPAVPAATAPANTIPADGPAALPGVEAAQSAPSIQPVAPRPQARASGDAASMSETTAKDAAATPAKSDGSAQAKPAGFADLLPQAEAQLRTGNTGEEPPRAAAELPEQPTAERAPVATKDAATDVTARPHDATAKTTADLVQNLGMTPATHTAPTQSTAAAHAAPAASPTPAPTAAVPVAGLAVEIAAQSLAGKNRFEIRLDPPELGRIDVRLEIDNDGHVKSRLIVERAETLDMLRRDAPQLERALQQAGLKTSDNALEFSLRDQAPQRDEEASQNANRLVMPDEDSAPVGAVSNNYGRLLGLGGGLDIRV